MTKPTLERLKPLRTGSMYPDITLTPVLEHTGDFVRIHHVDVEWPEGDGVQAYVLRDTSVRDVMYLGNGVGSCTCALCGSYVDTGDSYCRRCGAMFTETTYRKSKDWKGD